MSASKGPLGYTFHVLSYVSVTNRNALDVEETNRLIDGLFRALKAYFMRDTLQAVPLFTLRLKSVAVEHAYKQIAGYGGTSAASLASLANAETAAASALALQRLLPASKSQGTVPAYINSFGNAATRNDQVSELVKSANKDPKIKALEKQIKGLMVQH